MACDILRNGFFIRWHHRLHHFSLFFHFSLVFHSSSSFRYVELPLTTMWWQKLIKYFYHMLPNLVCMALSVDDWMLQHSMFIELTWKHDQMNGYMETFLHICIWTKRSMTLCLLRFGWPFDGNRLTFKKFSFWHLQCVNLSYPHIGWRRSKKVQMKCQRTIMYGGFFFFGWHRNIDLFINCLYVVCASTTGFHSCLYWQPNASSLHEWNCQWLWLQNDNILLFVRWQSHDRK